MLRIPRTEGLLWVRELLIRTHRSCRSNRRSPSSSSHNRSRGLRCPGTPRRSDRHRWRRCSHPGHRCSSLPRWDSTYRTSSCRRMTRTPAARRSCSRNHKHHKHWRSCSRGNSPRTRHRANRNSIRPHPCCHTRCFHHRSPTNNCCCKPWPCNRRRPPWRQESTRLHCSSRKAWSTSRSCCTNT